MADRKVTKTEQPEFRRKILCSPQKCCWKGGSGTGLSIWNLWCTKHAAPITCKHDQSQYDIQVPRKSSRGVFCDIVKVSLNTSSFFSAFVEGTGLNLSSHITHLVLVSFRVSESPQCERHEHEWGRARGRRRDLDVLRLVDKCFHAAPTDCRVRQFCNGPST